MNCPNCNAGLNGAPKFCPKCGTKIEARTVEPPATKKCPQCGSENAPAAKFCKVDGYRFDSGTPASAVPAAASRQEPSLTVVAAATTETFDPVTAQASEKSTLKEPLPVNPLACGRI